ncbi:MAG: hypothetical protein KTR21_09840 [Rhodobacteraceae bacterium]|nr:hypothetical protein [Paracoccaceae bacterium]
MSAPNPAPHAYERADRMFTGLVWGHADKCFSTDIIAGKDAQHISDLAQEIFRSIEHDYQRAVEEAKAGLVEFLSRWNKDMCALLNAGETDPKKLFIPREALREHADAIFKQHLHNACYPFIACKPRYFQRSIIREEHKDFRSDAYFGVDLTRPQLFKDQILSGLEGILQVSPDAAAQSRERNVKVFIGRSRSYIPLQFVLEEQELLQDIQKQSCFSHINTLGEVARQQMMIFCRQDVRFVFPSPDLIDIDDQLVDGSFKYKRLPRERYRLLPYAIEAKKRDSDAAFEYLHQERTKLKLAADAHQYWTAPSREQTAHKDGIVSSFTGAREIAKPLSYFRALRVDYSYARLDHYSGGLADKVGKIIFFTNYGFYIEMIFKELIAKYVLSHKGELYLSQGLGVEEGSFQSDARPRKIVNYKRADYSQEIASEDGRYALIDVHELVSLPEGKSAYSADWSDFTFENAAITWQLLSKCQMPTLSYRPINETPDNLPPITIVNIGVGPSNAKTATDLLAAYRPLCWLMLGHCGGLRMSQELGQYVLASDYKRDDTCMNRNVHPETPIQAVAPVQQALRAAIETLMLEDFRNERTKAGEAADAAWEERLKASAEWNNERRRRVRMGTVITTDDRNWELLPYDEIIEWVEQSRAIAVDMESATIAANGFRYRIPYGTLLCVSDKPLVGEGKMRGAANNFYDTATQNHVRIGLEAARILYAKRAALRQSRQLNGLDDPPFG